MDKKQFAKNAALSGRLVTEGMVLLENDGDLLPFHELHINIIAPERIGCSFNYFNIRREP